MGRASIEHDIKRLPARDVGHEIIAFAAVASPEHLLAVLQGKRKGRWAI